MRHLRSKSCQDGDFSVPLLLAVGFIHLCRVASISVRQYGNVILKFFGIHQQFLQTCVFPQLHPPKQIHKKHHRDPPMFCGSASANHQRSRHPKEVQKETHEATEQGEATAQLKRAATEVHWEQGSEEVVLSKRFASRLSRFAHCLASKRRVFFNQNKDHLASRYMYVRIYFLRGGCIIAMYTVYYIYNFPSKPWTAEDAV